MWADAMTKPKQGKAYRVFRSVIMNVPEDYVDSPMHQGLKYKEITKKGAKVLKPKPMLK